MRITIIKLKLNAPSIKLEGRNKKDWKREISGGGGSAVVGENEIYEIASADKSQFYETQFHYFFRSLSLDIAYSEGGECRKKYWERENETTVTMQ